MSFIGKLHEFSFYGLISTILALISGKLTFTQLIHSYVPANAEFVPIFICVLFWASVLFIPIAVIGAFATKYSDDGEALSFKSDNIFIIILGHIGEELLGLLLTPFWFLRDVFKHDWDGEKIADYVTWVIVLAFYFFGLILL